MLPGSLTFVSFQVEFLLFLKSYLLFQSIKLQGDRAKRSLLFGEAAVVRLFTSHYSRSFGYAHVKKLKEYFPRKMNKTETATRILVAMKTHLKHMTVKL